MFGNYSKRKEVIRSNLMIDYKFKSEVMAKGFDLLQKDVSKSFYADYVLNAYGLVARCKYTIEEAEAIDQFMQQNYPLEWKEGQKINHAHYYRVKRLKTRIANMLDSGKCIFLTFTFTDEILAKTTADTRRQKVRRYLAQYNCPYVANIDFGKKNGREHYHAIIQCDSIDYKLYDYGNLDGERIVNSANDNVKLAKYISKLTNHAIKETTKQNYIIYSRD